MKARIQDTFMFSSYDVADCKDEGFIRELMAQCLLPLSPFVFGTRDTGQLCHGRAVYVFAAGNSRRASALPATRTLSVTAPLLTQLHPMSLESRRRNIWPLESASNPIICGAS